MRRILLSAALSSGVLLTSAVPLLGTAAAAACPSWTDPAGDAGLKAPNGQVVEKDETVDITAVKVEQTSKAMIVTFTVPGLANYNSFLPGERFGLEMTAGGTTTTVFSDRDDFALGEKTGVIVGTSSFKGGYARYDVPGKKLVITMPWEVFTTALKKPVSGLELKAFDAFVDAQLSWNGRAPVGGASGSYMNFDTATGPATAALVGGAGCTGATELPAIPAITTGATPTDAPVAGCTYHVTDATGDAKPISPQAPNDPDLDITGVTHRTTGDWFMTYVKVDKLAAGPSSGDGHRFSVDFTFNGNVFTVAASSFKNAQSQTARDTIASTGLGSKTVQMSVNPKAGLATQHSVFPPVVESGSKAVFDTGKSLVTIAVPVADIQKYGNAPFAGATLEAINVKSAVDYWRNSFIADYSSKSGSTSTDKWTVGDNRCFVSATKIALTVVKTGATRTVTAKLTTVSGQPVAAQNIVFYVNNKKSSTVKTAANGTAVLKKVKAGSTVKATFATVPGYTGSTASKKV